MVLAEALGGCERLMKVGYLASSGASCAWGTMQQLKDCNYSIMVEVDWIRVAATGWDQDRRPGNGHGRDIISLSWQLKTRPVNTLLPLKAQGQGDADAQAKQYYVHESALTSNAYKHKRTWILLNTHTHTHSHAPFTQISASPSTHKPCWGVQRELSSRWSRLGWV